MFPKLDGDLTLVVNQFRFDHVVVTDASESLHSTEYNHLSEFPSNEEDEEEPTLSNDCLLNVDDTAEILNRKEDVIVSKATKVLEEIINKTDIPKRRSETSLIDSAKNVTSMSSTMRKQLSLHETSSVTSLINLNKENAEKYPRRNIELSRFLSVDNRSISDTEDSNEASNSGFSHRNDGKTQSCANLKLSFTVPHSPGAVVVKEKYIELPKRVTHSFHGKTSKSSIQLNDPHSMQINDNTKRCSTSKQSISGMTKPRFTTTMVDETQLGDSALKEV